MNGEINVKMKKIGVQFLQILKDIPVSSIEEEVVSKKIIGFKYCI